MSNQYFNFSYDPIRQGYDSTTWNTILGVPVVAAGKLSIANAGIIHYADILRGDFIFNVNISAPAAGDDIKIGLIEYNKDAYLYFKIEDDVFTAETSNGVDTNSISLTWDSSWDNTDTEFRIKWEAGDVTFFIGGQFKATLSDITIPGDPLSLYVYSDSTNPLLLKYIDAKDIQSMY